MIRSARNRVGIFVLVSLLAAATLWWGWSSFAVQRQTVHRADVAGPPLRQAKTAGVAATPVRNFVGPPIQRAAFLKALLKSEEPGDRQYAISCLEKPANQQGQVKSVRDFQRIESPMLEGGRYSDAETAAREAIAARPYDVSLVDEAQYSLALSLLNSGRLEESVRAAKACYNVCRIKTTPRAAALLATSLKKLQGARSNLSDAWDEFRHQQLTSAFGAENTNVLSHIPDESSAYEPTVNQLVRSSNAQDQLAAGNLLLLEGKPELAEKAFSLAAKYAGASSGSITDAVEGFLRCEKARSARPEHVNTLRKQILNGSYPASLQEASTSWSPEQLTAARHLDMLHVDKIVNAIDHPEASLLQTSDESVSDGVDIDPVSLATNCASPDPALIAWLRNWRVSWSKGGSVTDADRDKLRQILSTTCEPSIQLFAVAYAVHFRSESDFATAFQFYDAASRAAESELGRVGSSPDALPVLQAMHDQMQDYKDVLWHLIEYDHESAAVETLYRIYTNYLRYTPVDNPALSPALVHVTIGQAECLCRMSKAVEAMQQLATLQNRKMTTSEGWAYEWATALAQLKMRNYAAAIPHLEAVATVETPYTDFAVGQLADSEAHLGNAAAAQKYYELWLKRRSPTPEDAQTFFMNLKYTLNYTKKYGPIDQ